MPPKTKQKAKTADEFAATQSPRPQRRAPWITQLPEWDELKTAYRSGITPRVLYEWLIAEKGYTPDALRSPTIFRVALLENLDR